MSAVTPSSSKISSTNGEMPSGASRSVIERIRKPSGELKRLGICIYGRPGVGKTTLLGTMPGKGLVIDVPQVEGGTVVLADKADRISILPIGRWEEIDDVFKFLRHDKHDFQWVAFDTLTACQELAKRRAFKDREHDLASDPHQVTQQDYGKIGQLMSELIYKMRTLPIHVIFLAQERRRDSEEGGTEFQPDLTPASLASLVPNPHLIGRLSVHEVDNDGNVAYERRLRVGPHRMYLSKARNAPGRDLPPVIKNPNLGQILAYMLGKDIACPEGVAEAAGLGQLVITSS